MNVGKERRRYFRVSDIVLMSYRLIEDASESKLEVEQDPLLAALNELEEKVLANMQRLRAQNEAGVAETFDLFNQKINLIAGGVVDSPVKSDVGVVKTELAVNISACGIAFPSERQLEVGRLLELDIVLKSSYISVKLVGQIVSVDANPSNLSAGTDTAESRLENRPLLIRVDFVDVTDVDQELLVQHVLKRQSAQLKAQREAQEKGENGESG